VSRHRPKGVRPVLLLVVYGMFLVVVGVTATAQTVLVSLHFNAAAINTAVAADVAIVGAFANEGLQADDLTARITPERADEVQQRLASLAVEAGIGRIDVRDTDGTIRLSTRADQRGATVIASQGFAVARDGQVSATIVGAGELSDLDPGAVADVPLLRAYLPLLDTQGQTRAVIGVWRDARPILGPLVDVQSQMLIVTLFAAGVAGVLLFVVFRSAQQRISRQTEQLLAATRRDPLTGMLNHGALVADLADMVERARTDSSALTVALLDLDNFKLLNDTHGHEAGDQALTHLAATIERLQPSDAIVGRYGPDEFLIAAPATSMADVEPAVERLREALVGESLQFGSSERLPMTVSAGIANVPSDADSVTELLSIAAQVLGEAKASGGDAVRVASRSATSEDAGAFNVLQGLVFAIDTKDRYTKRHSEDVARYSVFLAGRLGLDPDIVETIRVAGLLHDVGKVGIPESILRKPGKLTAAEMDVVKQHVALGHAIVRDLVSIDIVRLGIRHHHERWDGNGYLDGLGGADIPLVARILAVGDAFSAMTTTRPYRKALSVEESLRRLLDAASSQLDEHLVTAFVHGIETAPDAPLPGVDPVGGLWVSSSRVA
jgi:diguanylate cyclase (GGDEF)-like protein